MDAQAAVPGEGGLLLREAKEVKCSAGWPSAAMGRGGLLLVGWTNHKLLGGQMCPHN